MQSLVLASTPPQHAPSRPRRTTSGSAGSVVAFRDNTTNADPTGSLSRGNSASFMETHVGMGSWRSLSARMSTSTKTAEPSPPLPHTRSIPKSASYVKVEGFNAPADDTLASSPPLSPGRDIGRASSLLSRQLSVDNMTTTTTTLTRPIPSSGSLSTLAERLEAQVMHGEAAIKPSFPASSTTAHPTPTTDDPLLRQLSSQYPVFHEPLVARAFAIARTGHYGNQPAFARCAGAATIIAELGADEVAVAAALLHDVLERSMFTEPQLREKLKSDEAVELVKRISHMAYVCQKYRGAKNTTALDGTASQKDASLAHGPSGVASHLVDMLVAQGPPRALLVRLAVALQEARALEASSRTAQHRGWAGAAPPPTAAASRVARRQRAAAEALEVWAPLANRLGVWSVKAELEDRAFCTLRPDAYAELRERLEEAQEPTRLVALVDALRAQLQAAGVEYIDLSGRPKHLWGVWRKMQVKGYSAERVRDVRGLRVIVKSREDCYLALRAVERAWAVVGESKNYIKAPKANGYQSLHCVADPGDGHLVEVQIRTDKMHYLAEYGAEAAHWRYKEKKSDVESTTTAAALPPSPPLPLSSLHTNGNTSHNRETNWAKFMTSLHVVRDKKCRPSGSPSGDQSLASILASMDGGAMSSSDEDSPSPSHPLSRGLGTSPGNNRRTFQEYIAASGQCPVPPEEERALVAVVAGGSFSVAELPAGTTVSQLLRSCSSGGGNSTTAIANATVSTPTPTLSAVVNRHVVEAREVGSMVLRAGDVVELYAEQQQVLPPPPVRTPCVSGNMLPIAGLTKKLAMADLSS